MKIVLLSLFVLSTISSYANSSIGSNRNTDIIVKSTNDGDSFAVSFMTLRKSLFGTNPIRLEVCFQGGEHNESSDISFDGVYSLYLEKESVVKDGRLNTRSLTPRGLSPDKVQCDKLNFSSIEDLDSKTLDIFVADINVLSRAYKVKVVSLQDDTKFVEQNFILGARSHDFSVSLTNISTFFLQSNL